MGDVTYIHNNIPEITDTLSQINKDKKAYAVVAFMKSDGKLGYRFVGESLVVEVVGLLEVVKHMILHPTDEED